MKIYDLPVMQGREKSFYGKARIIEKDNGEKVLQSYKTEVCKITSAVVDLGNILEQSERERAQYTEEQAERLLTHLIYQELVKGAAGR